MFFSVFDVFICFCKDAKRMASLQRIRCIDQD